jgi:hypothetical protein
VTKSGLPRYLLSWRDEWGRCGDTRMSLKLAMQIARRYKARRRWSLVIDTATCRRIAEFGSPFAKLKPMDPERMLRP